MKHCIRCGKELPDNAVFCDGCGTNLRRRRPAENELPGLKTINKLTRIMILACIVAGLIVGVMYIFMGKSSDKPQPGKEPVLQRVLPCELQFGVSYDAFAVQMEAAGYKVSPLKNADGGDGYVVNPVHETGAEADAQMEITLESQDQKTVDSRDTAYYFTFNRDKQLSGFRWVNDTKTEANAESLLQALAKDYIPRFGISRYQEGESSFTWADKDYKVTISYDKANNQMILSVQALSLS